MTVLDAFDLAVCDDAELGRRAAAGDARARRELIERYVPLARSLALRYRWVMQALEDLGGRSVEVIRIVGGGSRNHLLCQLTADATGRRVVAGPVEATALGNIMVQVVATGHLQDLDAGRKAIEASAHLETFDPQPSADWDGGFLRFQSLLRTTGS